MKQEVISRKKYVRIRRFAIILSIVFVLMAAASSYLIIRGGVLDKVLIKLNLKEESVNYDVASWVRCIEKLDYDADIAFLGDSLTAQSNFQIAFPEFKIIELGRSGDTIEGMTNRVSMLTATTPEKIFILGGINSVRDYNVNTCLEEYEDLLIAIQTNNPDAEIYVQSVLPVSEEKEKTVLHNTTIVKFNDGLEKFAAEYNCEYISLYDLFEQDGYINPELTADGVHLSEAGYSVWETAISDYILP